MLRIPGKIPITIYPLFLFVAAIIGWLSSEGNFVSMFIWIFVILISVLCHEFGHALTALAFGQNANIELTGFGGLTQRKGGKLKLWQEFFVVLDGPIAGILLGIVSAILLFNLSNRTTFFAFGLQISMYVNFFWTFLNLLPVYPLDGGHLMSIVLQGIFGFRGLRYALFFSMLFAGVASIFFFMVKFVLAGAILLIMAFESYRAWQGVKSMTESDQDEKLQDELKNSEDLIIQGHVQEAYDKLETVRKKSKEGIVYTVATEDMAKVLEDNHDYTKAYELLETIQQKLTPEGIRLFHHLSYLTGHWEKAVSIGDEAFQMFPSYDVAILNALSHGSLGHATEAVGWLQRAAVEGAPDIRKTIQRKEFNTIRNQPEFQSWVRSL